MCAGELESMCQHVVCFSFEAACRCSNEKPIHMQTWTHTWHKYTHRWTWFRIFVFMYLARGDFSGTDILDGYAHIAIQTKHTEQKWRRKKKWIDTALMVCVRLPSHVWNAEKFFFNARQHCILWCVSMWCCHAHDACACVSPFDSHISCSHCIHNDIRICCSIRDTEDFFFISFSSSQYAVCMCALVCVLCCCILL